MNYWQSCQANLTCLCYLLVIHSCCFQLIQTAKTTACAHILACCLFATSVVVSKARTCGNEPANNDVFLKPPQVIPFAHDSRFSKHASRFLEGGCGNERVGR